ncbi:aldo/keto reductase [Streptosporangium sp. NPDC005286]|uniref:aldo/keto reductase n=1 Tax=Streptosporangium sp. NPDC005286 TaxID=3154463 RepID=UPI0033BB654D
MTYDVKYLIVGDFYGPHVANDLIREALHPYPDDLVIAPVVAVQNRFHLFDRDSEDVLTACEEHGIAFVPYFPLAAGMLKPGLDTSQAPPGMAPTEEQQRTLDQVAGRHGATRTQVALAWLPARSPVILAIPGTGSVAHLEENVAAADLRLTESDIARLDELA